MNDFDTRERAIGAYWREAERRLALVDREPPLRPQQLDALLAARILDDERLRPATPIVRKA